MQSCFARFLLAALLLAGSATAAVPPGTVVLDDSLFWGRMALKDQVADADSLKLPFLFNNTALLLNSMANIDAEVRIPEAGTYYLYARARTTQRNSFRVAIGDRVSPSVRGDGKFAFQRVDRFDLPAGPVPVRLTRIFTAPVLDVLVLSKRADLREDELAAMQLAPDVRLLKEYKIPEPLSVNFGDADNDGRLDMLVVSDGFRVHVINHEGRELWASQVPKEGAEVRNVDDINGLIWDLDGDGKSEVLHWGFLDGAEYLVAADGATGRVKYKTPWPAPPLPHPYWNSRIAIANFHPGRADAVIVYSDTGGTILLNAYTIDLKLLWSHIEKRAKDHLGHYPYVRDINGDGIEEVIVSSLVLDSTGKTVWNRFDLFDDNHDHADEYRFVDLNGDGRMELVAPWSDVGVVALDALTGKRLWWSQGEHTQRLQTGNFLDGVAGPHLAGSARFYGDRKFEPYLWAQVHWLNRDGKLLSKWPENPLNINPVFAKGDWDGGGREDLFWHQFRMMRNGTGSLYFSEPVYHMFDFLGDRADEVITIRGGSLKVYGNASSDHREERFRRDREYVRTRLANHDH